MALELNSGCRERSSQPCQRFNKDLPIANGFEAYRIFGRSHLGHTMPAKQDMVLD